MKRSHSTQSIQSARRLSYGVYEVATTVDIFFFSRVLTSSEYIVLFTSLLSSSSSVAVSECASVLYAVSHVYWSSSYV